MILWYPDFCPGGQCVIQENADGSKVGFVSACAHHQAQRVSLGDSGTFAAIAASCKAKEKAREVVQQQLAMSNTPDVRTETNGSFSVMSGAKGGTLSSLRTAVSNAVAEYVATPGCSPITVVT